MSFHFDVQLDIEWTFQMRIGHEVQARPVWHHKRESIAAHLTIAFAALAVSYWIETQPAGA